MRSPLVTITIPTYNSGKSLRDCLASIERQTYKEVEINIIDGQSSDETVKVAHKFGEKNKNRLAFYTVKTLKGSLLEARYRGVKLAKGDFILILDSDQILEKDSIQQAVKLVERKKFDMLAFEENVYTNTTFVEKLFEADRKLINTVNDLSPYTGVIMPRFFKADILKKAYDSIPKEVFPNTGGPDHAIVYYEAWLISKRVGVLPNAVKHIEPSTLLHLWRKFYRWGYTSVDAHYGKYSKLMSQKERFRTGLFTKGLFLESLSSVLLLILKGIPFKLGFYKAKLDIMVGRRNED